MERCVKVKRYFTENETYLKCSRESDKEGEEGVSIGLSRAFPKEFDALSECFAGSACVELQATQLFLRVVQEVAQHRIVLLFAAQLEFFSHEVHTFFQFVNIGRYILQRNCN